MGILKYTRRQGNAACSLRMHDSLLLHERGCHMPGLLRRIRRYRLLVMVFAFWLALEPLAVSVLQAQELPAAKVNPETVTGLVPAGEVLTPLEQMRYIYELRGKTPEEFEAGAWSDWMMSISNVYTMMDEGSQDAVTLYAGVRSVFDVVSAIPGASAAPEVIRILVAASKKTLFLAAFLRELRPAVYLRNLINGFAISGTRFGSTLQQWKFMQVLEFMNPPECWNNPEAAEKGMSAWWHWAKKGNQTQGQVLETYKGVARGIGIGLTVLGLVLDSYKLATSDDVHGGRLTSYDTVKTATYAVLGAAILICMFCPPPFGFIAGIAMAVWSVLTFVGDMVGAEFKRWRQAYQSSYFYLYQNDPAFRSAYENRGALRKPEKAISLLIAERDFGQVLTQKETGNKTEDEVLKRGKRVYENMVKQGVLMTYYSGVACDLNTFDIKELAELWKAKASYMAWKPNEKEVEDQKKAGFWGKALNAINPMRLVRGIADNIGSKSYKEAIDKKDIRPVYFNPDFILVKKYKNYLVGKRLKGGIFDLVGIRLEQAPFNYIPLVGISTAEWTPTLLAEAFHGDAMLVGSKEIRYLREQAKRARDEIEKVFDGQEKLTNNLRRFQLPALKTQREALAALLSSWQANKDQPLTPNQRWSIARGLKLVWPTEAGSQPTPAMYFDRFKDEISQALQFVPLTLGKHALDLIQLDLTCKRNLDLAALMEAYVREKSESLSQFDQDFKNPDIKRYLQEGSFLNVDGGGIFNWLAENYSAFEETRKYTELLAEEVESYKKKAEKGGAALSEPDQLLTVINAELAAFAELNRKFEPVAGDLGVTITYASDEESFQKVFPVNGFKMMFGKDRRKPLDVTRPVLEIPAGAQVAPEAP